MSMELIMHSSEIKVGDIISEQGVISDTWDDQYEDSGTEYNEFTRFIVLEKINKEDTPMCITGANKYYFKVCMLYMIQPIAAMYKRMEFARCTVTDYEIDEEDYDKSMATNTPRNWYKCI